MCRLFPTYGWKTMKRNFRTLLELDDNLYLIIWIKIQHVDIRIMCFRKAFFYYLTFLYKLHASQILQQANTTA